MEYPALDREPITWESDRYVHFVIIGMSRMGVALGVEAAHLLHFPNFCRDKRLKSRITFIDADADKEETADVTTDTETETTEEAAE